MIKSKEFMKIRAVLSFSLKYLFILVNTQPDLCNVLHVYASSGVHTLTGAPRTTINPCTPRRELLVRLNDLAKPVQGMLQEGRRRRAWYLQSETDLRRCLQTRLKSLIGAPNSFTIPKLFCSLWEEYYQF